MKKSIKNKKNPRKTYKKKGKKQNRYKQKRRTFRKRKSYKQRGGFVVPFIGEGYNLSRGAEYQLQSAYNLHNPPPYAAPSNPTNVVNPHPAYDQYVTNNGKMIDPKNEMGPRLPEVFDNSISNTQQF